MKVLDLFFASRPLLQIPIWTVYLISLHYHHNLSGGKFEFSDLIIMSSISLLFTSAVYLNQIFDFKSDQLNQKVGFLQKGFLTQRELLVWYLVLLLPPILAAPFLSKLTFFIFAQFVFFGFAYSIPPLSLKDRPISGLIVNSYAHGMLVALAVMPEMTMHNTGLLGWDNPFYFFLAVGSTYILTTIPDLEGDRKTGKKTLAVVLGRNTSVVISALFAAASGWVAYKSGFLPLVIVSLVAFILTSLLLLIKRKSITLLSAKLPLLLLTLIAGYYYPIYLLFIVALIISCRIYYKKRFGLEYPKLS